MNATSTSADCLVIGGGLMGLLSARALRHAGFSVILLERGRIGREASWAGGGILSPLMPWKHPDAIWELAAWSQQRYSQLADELREETGVDTEWLPSGLLHAAAEPDPTITQWTQRFGVRLEVLDAAQAGALEPSLRPAVGSTLRFPDVAQIRSPLLCEALHKAAGLQGVRMLEHTEVTGIDVHAGRVRGVHTANGHFSAARVVLAGGAWSARILSSAGLQLAITPVRGQMLLFRAPPGLFKHILMERGYYLIPRRDGLVLAGSTLEYADFDKATTPQARETLSRAAVDLVPALAHAAVIKQWSGLRPGSKDGVPFIGECPGIEGLFLNTGHFRNGVVLAPASARVLLDCMLEQEGFTDYRPFLPQERSLGGASRAD